MAILSGNTFKREKTDAVTWQVLRTTAPHTSARRLPAWVVILAASVDEDGGNTTYGVFGFNPHVPDMYPTDKYVGTASEALSLYVQELHRTSGRCSCGNKLDIGASQCDDCEKVLCLGDELERQEEMAEINDDDADRIYDKLVELWNEEVSIGSDPLALAEYIRSWGQSSIEEVEWQKEVFGKEEEKSLEVTSCNFCASGDNPKYSTGICGNITAGHGNLDDNGYWEYPCPIAMKSIRRERM